MYAYHIYGLSIHSALPLPELLSADTAAFHGDVNVNLGSIKYSPPANACVGSTFWVSPNETYLSYQGAGAFLVRNGNDIVVDPCRDAVESEVRLCLLSQVLAVLLHQRGFLVLHASAVTVNGHAVAFLGEAGAGKSTMAGAMYARGHPVLVDDVMGVSFDGDRPTISVGSPQLRLCHDASLALGYIDEPLSPSLPSAPRKQAYQTSHSCRPSSSPLVCIYLLTEGAKPAVKLIPAITAFLDLVGHSYMVRLLEATDTIPLHFNQCAHLARKVTIAHLIRPRKLSQLPQVAQMIEQEVHQ